MLKEIIELVDNNHCTACGSCVQACPKKCISLINDEYGCKHAVINHDSCIKCGNCKTVCHLHKFICFNKSDEVYAAWSNDTQTRNTSASGGIATEIYKMCIANNIHCYGAEYKVHDGVKIREILSSEDVENVRNSKYVYSSMDDCYSTIKKQLLENEKVLFVGLPCQIAGLKCFLHNTPTDNLLLIDIVCHGTCPHEYLDQHIKAIEDKKGEKADSVMFRNPDFGTEKYCFTLKNQRKVFYNKGVNEDDLYQIGYHKMLIYREACYNCKYARPERMGDLTIADFSGLGRIKPWTKQRESISMIIVSSEKGKILLDNLLREEKIYAELRPSDEAFMFEHQLQNPSIPHYKRQIFLSEYRKTHDFEHSANVALAEDVRKNRIRMFLHIELMRSLITKIIPKRVKTRIKKIIEGFDRAIS